MRQSRRREPFHGCSTATLRQRRMKRLASAGLVRPMKARYRERKNTPLCRQTSASHPASRRVHPRAISPAARPSSPQVSDHQLAFRKSARRDASALPWPPR